MTPIALFLALTSGPAHAESEILFRTTRPVVILVDGRQAPLTGNLKMKAGDLDPGLHDIEVRGVFGKTLYTTAMELPDWTVAHTEWTGATLRVTRTEVLEPVPDRLGPSPWADEEEEARVASEPVDAGPIVIPAPVPANIPAPAPEAAPEAAPVADEPVADADASLADSVEADPAEAAVAPAAVQPEAPLAIPATAPPPAAAPPTPVAPAPAPATPEPAPEQAAALPPVAAGEIAWIGGSDEALVVEPPRTSPTMRVQAREGVQIELVSEQGVLVVTVEDGRFVVDVAE